MRKSIYKKLDWPLIGCFLFLLLFGWINVYSALRVEDSTIFDLSQRYGMHLVWIGISIFFILLILFVVPHKFYSVCAHPLYMLMMIVLLATIFLGVEVKGSRSWLALGAFNIQPAEFSKITTSLAIAAIVGKYGFKFDNIKDAIKAFLCIGIPMLLIIAEKETGSALVYLGFLLVFFCEGMSGWPLILGLAAILLFIITLVFSPFVSILVAATLCTLYYFSTRKKGKIWMVVPLATLALLAFLPKLLEIEIIAKINPFSPSIWAAIIVGATALFFLVRSIIIHSHESSPAFTMLCLICAIGFTFSVQFIFNSVLKPHQKARIESMLGIKDDPMGVGYNVHQSMIAIGSGGFSGKGFMQGTQTHFDFVPEQGTDFIFCTVGEEWGLIGTVAVLAVYLFMILRIFHLASRNKVAFIRIYGYCVACCIFMHVFINVAMTIGLMPVIGIPLPFLSYGGSSLLAFSILLFIFVRLDLERRI